MKKDIPKVRERESEASILGNDREREFPLTPALLMTLPTMTNDDTNSILTGDAKRKGNFSYGVKPGVHCAFGNILK